MGSIILLEYRQVCTLYLLNTIARVFMVKQATDALRGGRQIDGQD
ncbi:hypothetical protein ASZ90_018629 [hydrocarbon metagenome]|uniref:Uncharacterized protein n=1 Tax=hydrocarbon metagenome TaxID=938273 RepID=A0A0W8E5N6_9ZZZZ